MRGKTRALLTDDALTKVKAAALTKEGSSATIVRIETDGHAPYEAHILRPDGTPVTVYVDKSFNIVSVETR